MYWIFETSFNIEISLRGSGISSVWSWCLQIICFKLGYNSLYKLYIEWPSSESDEAGHLNRRRGFFASDLLTSICETQFLLDVSARIPRTGSSDVLTCEWPFLCQFAPRVLNGDAITLDPLTSIEGFDFSNSWRSECKTMSVHLNGRKLQKPASCSAKL